MQKARLENWRVLFDGDLLCGNVYGHPRFKDGEEIVTSRVASLDLSTGKAVTRNTEYELGEPATDGGSA